MGDLSHDGPGPSTSGLGAADPSARPVQGTRPSRRRATVVLLVAARLTRRDVHDRGGGRWWLWGPVAVMVGAGAPVFAGAGAPWLAALSGAAAIALLAAICTRWFTPGLAVSVLGVALACASLMTAFAVTTGFERAIVRVVSGLNGHVLLTKYGLDFFEYEDVARRWVEDPRITAASPFAYSMVALVAERGDDAAPEGFPETPHNAMGKGLHPAFARDLRGIEDFVDGGDLAGLRPGDTRHVPGLIVGHRLAEVLGVGVGDRVRVVVPAAIDGHDGSAVRPPRHASFEVLDLLRTGVSDVDREVVLMHITAAQALFFREGRVTGIEFELDDPDAADEVGADIEAELGSIYRTTTWKRTQSVFLVSLRQIRAALTVILGLMILVSSASLIASLLLLVRRKRADIAILRTMGGDASLSFWVFEGVGLLVGVVGAAAGIALGGFYCLLLWSMDLGLQGDIYPVQRLPVHVAPLDALAPALAAIVLCAVASGPVAAAGAGAPILGSLRR